MWIGYGVWTQLWASMTLPLAWGFSWRAIREHRGYLPAAGLVALTAALHFETGYLALAPILVWPFVAGRPLAGRLRSAVIVLIGALGAIAWVLVPLVAQRSWAAVNEPLQGTPLVNGYGAGRMLSWLITGQLLDHGRLPVLTACAAVGLLLAVRRWRDDVDERALLVVLAISLMLSFGRTTWGSLTHVIPGGGDVFFRRFLMGVQLAALLLAGRGAAATARTVWRSLDRWAVRHGLGSPAMIDVRVRTAIGLSVTVLVLIPAWSQLAAYDRLNSAAISTQRRADATEGTQVDRLLATVRTGPQGRVYAGMPSNWGATFTVGAVPVFKFLESRDVDEVGYTLRTASLMTDPEYFFDQGDAGDATLFGIRYLILPAGSTPPIPARRIRRAGPYVLWQTPVAGYVSLGRIVGALRADRADVGLRSIPLLDSELPSHGDVLQIRWRAPTGAGTLLPAHAPLSAPIGAVLSERTDLAAGVSTAVVALHRTGVTVLSASFDPGWTATVDGHRRATLMVAPALVAVRVPRGRHTVTFTYEGERGYAALFAVAVAVLVALGVLDARRRRAAPGHPSRACNF